MTPRSDGSRGRHLPRLTAALVAALATAVAVEVLAAPAVAGYLDVLVGAAVVGAAVAAYGAWTRWTYDVRLLAGGLAATILLGQVLLSSLGGPGGPPPGWRVEGVAVAILAALVLALAALVSSPREQRRPPYAL